MMTRSSSAISREEIAEPAIEFLQRARVAGDIAAVTEEHVEIDQIGEDQPVASLSAQSSAMRCMPSAFEAVGYDSVIPSPAKMSLIFPTPITASSFADRVQHRRAAASSSNRAGAPCA